MKKVIFVFSLLQLATMAVFAQLRVTNLLCESKTNPVGVDMAQPRFTWQLESNNRNVMQSAYEIRVSADAPPTDKNTVWSTGKIASDASLFIPYGGSPLQSGKTYYWQVRVWDNQKGASAWSQPATWQMGLLQQSDWKASWIGTDAAGSTKKSPYFRKSFNTTKKVASATAYITSHGLYEAFINGKRVGNYFLTPGWTSYNKRLQYQVYDVTSLLQSGANAVGVALGSGWYRSPLAWEANKELYGKDLALLFQMHLRYTDGTEETIVSDGSWKGGTGAVQSSEIYNGEVYDAREDKKGWATAAFKDADWKPVTVTNTPVTNIIGTYNEPITAHENLKPIKIWRTPKGELVADFGQNMVGFVQLKLQGKKGDKVTIGHAEVLDKEGNFYTDNLRSAKQQNTFILNGEGQETFEPHFTFQGFRYIKVDGFPGDLKPENLTAVVLHSAMKPTGTFTSSHPLLNQLQHNIVWGQKGNFLDVPTDCPQRDERLGWTGDAQVFARTAAFNMNVNAFFSKWMKDVAADQLPNGSVPYVVPDVLRNDGGSAGWADAATIIPWNMYMAYGDKKILEDQYASMQKWVGYIQSVSKNNLWNTGFHFGDWLFYRPSDDNDGRSAITDKYMIAQAFWAHSLQMLINTAEVLGKKEDISQYRAQQQKVKDAYIQEYLTPSGRLISSSQTAYVLALHFDLLPEDKRAQAAARLVENIKSYNNHLTTGFLGTPYLCHVLTRFGYTDVAYTLLMQESYPSWLYPVKMGATTIWERWDGQKPDSTFQTPGMNSFNHYAYGAIGDWMYRTVAGIQEAAPGYKKITIKPHAGGGLTNAAASLQTYYGKVSSGWKLNNGALEMEVTVPPNTTAVVYVPAKSADGVKENGQPLSAFKGGKVGNLKEGYVPVEVGSGTYRFAAVQ